MLEFLAEPAIIGAQDHTEDSLPHLAVSLDKDSARVGSAVVLTLSYGLPAGANLAADPEIKGLEDLTVIERQINPGRITIKLLVDRLDSWQTGPLVLPYLDREGKAQIIKADPVSLTVLSNLGEKPDETELRPIQEIIPTTSLWLQYLPWAAVLFAVLLMAAGVLFWHKKRRTRKEIRQQPEPPHIQARKALEQLEEDRLFENGHVKEFYFRFSEIIRRYLECIRGFPAAEFTTEEIALVLDTARDRKILPLLRQSDLIKFAEAVPMPAKKDEDLKTAFLYIEENSPAPENGNSSNGIRTTVLKPGTFRPGNGAWSRSLAIRQDGQSQAQGVRSDETENQRGAAAKKKTWRDA
jgi:hypothetical protein